MAPELDAAPEVEVAQEAEPLPEEAVVPEGDVAPVVDVPTEVPELPEVDELELTLDVPAAAVVPEPPNWFPAPVLTSWQPPTSAPSASVSGPDRAT